MGFEELLLKKDEILYTFGEKAESFYYIDHGGIELYHDRKFGHVIVETCYSGEIIGSSEYLGGDSRIQKAVAKEDTTVFLLNKNNILDFASIFPAVAPTLKKLLSASEQEEETNPLLKELDVEHEDYLFPKETTCPVCGEKFKVNQIRYAKLMLKKLEDDFRSVFYNFDDLWYQIWTCPACGYMNFCDKYTELDIKTEKMLQVSLPRKTVSKVEHVKRNLKDVLDDYYELARYTEIYKMKPMTKARIWQSIAWLLEDLGDKDNVEFQYSQLMETLVDAWSNTTPLQNDIELKLAYKVSLLHEKNGDLENAINFLYKASETRFAKKVLKKRVNDKLFDMRERYRAEKDGIVDSIPSE